MRSFQILITLYGKQEQGALSHLHSANIGIRYTLYNHAMGLIWQPNMVKPHPSKYKISDELTLKLIPIQSYLGWVRISSAPTFNRIN